jgi:hypothetical protein
MPRTVKIDGQLLRFSANGVGAIEVHDTSNQQFDLPEVVYFEPGELSGYQGQTVQELQGGSFKLRPGKEMTVSVNVDGLGRYLSVQSVQIK